MLLVLGVVPLVAELLVLGHAEEIAIQIERMRNQRKHPYQLFWKGGIYLRLLWVLATLGWREAIGKLRGSNESNYQSLV